MKMIRIIVLWMYRSAFSSVVFFLAISLIFSCTPSGKLSNQNLSYVYQRKVSPPSVEYSLFQFSNDSSKIFFRINPQQFLAVKQSNASFFVRVAIKLQIYSAYESDEYNTIPDSVVFEVPVSNQRDTNYVCVKSLVFKNPEKDAFLLKLIIIDRNKAQTNYDFLQVHNTINPQNKNRFFCTKALNQEPYFNHFFQDDSLSLHFADSSKREFAVSYFYQDFPLADPPFSVQTHVPFRLKPDSLFFVQADTPFFFSKKGFYHFRTDTTDKIGFTLFRYENQFPAISFATEMLGPLRYLTSQKEYNDLVHSSNMKDAVDQFWLKVAGDPDRARQLIRKFYSRVQTANHLFSSYHQGWKTDRGMIFIVFGPPNAVYRTSDAETWIFGNPANLQSIVFTFVKVLNPYTDNDYQLSRSPLYQPVWYMAIEAWREGRLFNDK